MLNSNKLFRLFKFYGKCGRDSSGYPFAFSRIVRVKFNLAKCSLYI